MPTLSLKLMLAAAFRITTASARVTARPAEDLDSVGTPTDRQAVVHADGPYVLGHSLLGLQVIEGVTHTRDSTGQRPTRRSLSHTPTQNPK